MRRRALRYGLVAPLAVMVAGLVAWTAHDRHDPAQRPCVVSRLTSPLNAAGVASGQSHELILLALQPGESTCTLNGPLSVVIGEPKGASVQTESVTIDPQTGLEAPLVLDEDHWARMQLRLTRPSGTDGELGGCATGQVAATEIVIRGNLQTAPLRIAIAPSDSPLELCPGLGDEKTTLLDAEEGRRMVSEGQ